MSNQAKKKGKSKKGKGRYVRVKEGDPRRASADMWLELYTDPAKRNMEDTIEPATWMYRNLAGALAHNGFGQVVGDVNRVVTARLQTAIDACNETSRKMDRIVRDHSERLGVRISERGLGQPHEVKVRNIPGVTSKMIELAKAFDRAVLACDLAVAVDAIPHRAGFQEVGTLINHSRLVRMAVKKMRQFVVGRVSGEKIEVNDLVAELSETLENSLKNNAENLGLELEPHQDRQATHSAEQPATKVGGQPQSEKPEPKEEAKEPAGGSSALRRVLGGGR